MTDGTVRLGATALMYACQQGKESQVLDIIKTKPEAVEEREGSLKTALHYCAESGGGGVESAAALLLAAPALVTAQDQDGYTPLHLAVIAGNLPLASVLIHHGANLDTPDNEGHTSAHWATVCGEIECLELILKKSGNPDVGDMHGGRPLHYAAQMCGPGSEMPGDRRLGMGALRLLIDHGANPNLTDHHGRQPILWAASAGSSEAILVLVNAGANVEAADKDGLTALHCAASRGHTDCVETLISLCNAEVDLIDNNGCSPLFYAVTLGHADCTTALLNHGANTNRQDRKGRTAVHCGAAKGQTESLKCCWARSANMWARTARGDYPLHDAVASGRIPLVLWLLSLRPDAINAPNNDGRCPLHLAALHNNVEMCKVLLDAGSLVNPVMRTAKGMLATPLDAALHKGHRGCAKYLQLHGGVPANRLNSEAAALRGPNTRSSVALVNKVGLEESEQNVNLKTKALTLSSDKEIEVSVQKPSILQVYIEDGVTIRRIKPRQASESSIEENVVRRRRKKKPRHTSESEGQRLKNVLKKKVEISSNEEDDVISSQEENNEENDKSEKEKGHHNENEQQTENGDVTKQENCDFEHHSQIVTAIVHIEPQSEKAKINENETISEEEKKGQEEKTVEDEHFESKNASAPVSVSEDTAIDEMELVKNVEQILEKEITESQNVQPIESDLEKQKIEENVNNATKVEECCEVHDDFAAEDKQVEELAKCDEGENEEEQCAEIKLETEILGEKEETLLEKEIFVPEDVEQKTEIEAFDNSILEKKGGEQEIYEDSLANGENAVLEETEHSRDSAVDDNAKETAELAKMESNKMPSEMVEDIVAEKNDENVLESVAHEEKLCEYVSKKDSAFKQNIVKIPLDKGLIKVLDDRITRKMEGKRRSGSIEKKCRKDIRTESFELLSSTKHPSENEEFANERMSQVDVRASPGLESHLHDSGIEPSPKREKQTGRGARSRSRSRSRIPRACRKGRAFEQEDEMPSTVSVTQAVQYSVRKYHLERRIFHQLLELKRLQIRAGRASEGVLVKRLVDDYRRAGLMIGLQQYNGVYTFRAFEKYLYDQLRLLQSSEKRIIPRLRSSDDLELLSSALRKSKVGQDILTMIPTNPALCSYQTHRCYHATHAYTGIPCAAYLAGRNHHTMPKPGGSFLPKIVKGENHHEVAKTLRFVDPTRPITLELSHGSEKQVITLPTEKLDKTKRYFVTFTIKNGSHKKSEGQHVHATSV